jgi:hypothetical protein
MIGATGRNDASVLSVFGKGGCELTDPSLRLKSGRIEEQVKMVASPRNQNSPLSQTQTLRGIRIFDYIWNSASEALWKQGDA